jgi:hypothetical protein
MIHEQDEARRRMLIGFLVLAAIPFWAMVGLLSSVTMSAVMGDRHEVKEIRQYSTDAPPMQWQRTPDCGRVVPRYRTFILPSRPHFKYGHGEYPYRRGIQPIGLARGRYPHLELSGS